MSKFCPFNSFLGSYWHLFPFLFTFFFSGISSSDKSREVAVNEFYFYKNFSFFFNAGQLLPAIFVGKTPPLTFFNTY